MKVYPFILFKRYGFQGEYIMCKTIDEKRRSNQVLLSLGSNQDSERNIRCAARLLDEYFERITYSEPVYTDPVGTGLPGPFLNQVAMACTGDTPEEITKVLKQIERRLGRTPESKISGHIPIDIDLLQWNDRILKPADLEREYVRSGLLSLPGIEQQDERSEPQTCFTRMTD